MKKGLEMGFLVPKLNYTYRGCIFNDRETSVCRWEKITIKVMGKAQDLGPRVFATIVAAPKFTQG